MGGNLKGHCIINAMVMVMVMVSHGQAFWKQLRMRTEFNSNNVDTKDQLDKFLKKN